MQRIRLLTCALVLLPAFLARPAAADGPPNVDFDAIKKSPELGANLVKSVSERIDYWMAQIKDAPDASAVQAAREGLVGDFGKVEKGTYPIKFAELASQKAVATMKSLPADQSKGLKEANLAWAVSQMPQVAIQPALNEMVGYPNPAVRYYAWQGYRAIRTLIMSFPAGANDKPMYDALTKRAAEEKSGPVIGAIVAMLQVEPVAPQGLKDAYQRYRKAAYDIFQNAWPGWCKLALTGGPDMADAVRKGIYLIQQLPLAQNPPAQKKDLLQMVLDAAWCSAKAYGNAEEVDREEAPRIREANAQLLRDCESALQALSGTTNTFIQQRMGTPPTPGLGVLQWAKALAGEGVQSPERLDAATASAPASSAPTQKTE